MAVNQLQDFGEKIGGAKKDLWRERGLYSEDLDAMNDREAEHFVKKENVWKKPDYQALIDDGVPVGVVYYIKKVRDSLIAKPQYLRGDETPERRLERQKQFIQTIRDVQSAVEKVRTYEDVRRAFEQALLAGGYVERRTGGIGGPSYAVAAKGKNNPVITNKLFRAIHVRSEKEFEYEYVRKAVVEQFGVPKTAKVPSGYGVHLYEGGGYSSRDDWKLNTYYVTKGYRILQYNLPSKEAAISYAQEMAAEQRSANGKQRFVPPQLASVKRSGRDYRKDLDVSGQDYLDQFGFRGGEFGNWLNQTDRQVSLNMGYDALKDLAAALQIDEKDIAFQGTLAIAFGARGSGNAVAHYEPLRKVINLTKLKGAGSLAHEWWHALDDFLGQKMGVKGMLSEHPSSYPLMETLVDKMKYKPETLEQAAERTDRQRERMKRAAESWLDSYMLPALKQHSDEKDASRYKTLKEAFLSGEKGVVEQISTYKKDLNGHILQKPERERLEAFERTLYALHQPPVIQKTETDFYRDSKSIAQTCEKDGGYWDSNTEMTARAFACYVMDKIQPERSDYLCGHANSAISLVTDHNGDPRVIKAYPNGEERKELNAVFDELLSALKRDHCLTHAEHPLPKQHVAVIEQLSMLDDRPSVRAALAEAKHNIPRDSPSAHKREQHEISC